MLMRSLYIGFIYGVPKPDESVRGIRKARVQVFFQLWQLLAPSHVTVLGYQCSDAATDVAPTGLGRA